MASIGADSKQLNFLAEKIKVKVDKLDEAVGKQLKELAEYGARHAEAQYDKASEYEIESDVHVHIEPDGENGWYIVASGKEVMFLEFGAGIATDRNHPYANSPMLPFNVEPGSYSETHARQFSEKGYWFYKKKSYSFIPPTRGMYDASLMIKQAIQDGSWKSL